MYRSEYSWVIPVRPLCKIIFRKNTLSESEEGKVDRLSMQQMKQFQYLI
jgi:hypothetical protein